MTYIGRGLQYTVYDLGNGRVRKIPNGLFTMLKVLAGWGSDFNVFFHPLSVLRLARSAKRVTTRSISDLRKFLPEIDAALLANPTLSPKEGYDQDRVETIGEALNGRTEERAKELIHAYVLSVEERWRWGISETVFNFSVNSGIDAEGRIVLLDLGEATFSHEKVVSMIRDRVWGKTRSVTQLSENLRAFTILLMNEHLTEERLAAVWASKRAAV